MNVWYTPGRIRVRLSLIARAHKSSTTGPTSKSLFIKTHFFLLTSPTSQFVYQDTIGPSSQGLFIKTQQARFHRVCLSRHDHDMPGFTEFVYQDIVLNGPSSHSSFIDTTSPVLQCLFIKIRSRHARFHRVCLSRHNRAGFTEFNFQDRAGPRFHWSKHTRG